MLRRELPMKETAGRLMLLNQGRLAMAQDDTPLFPRCSWDEDVQPLCWWNDEPVGLLSIDTDNATSEVLHNSLARCEWLDGRAWMAKLPESWFPLLSTALQVGAWLANHRFCGRCGVPASRLNHEFAMHCDSCGHRNYPRISPCIITLVTHGESLLLARSPRFRPGQYSTLAGFIEPGESAEEAVHREVYEEVGLFLGEMRYFRSQAWPFPHALMLGYFAEAASRRIRIDQREISDAAWFSPRTLPRLPPPYSISRALIETHLAKLKDQ